MVARGQPPYVGRWESASMVSPVPRSLPAKRCTSSQNAQRITQHAEWNRVVQSTQLLSFACTHALQPQPQTHGNQRHKALFHRGEDIARSVSGSASTGGHATNQRSTQYNRNNASLSPRHINTPNPYTYRHTDNPRCLLDPLNTAAGNSSASSSIGSSCISSNRSSWISSDTQLALTAPSLHNPHSLPDTHHLSLHSRHSTH